MVYFIEGARNSGKSHISEWVNNNIGIKRFQYEFAKWFLFLELSDSSTEAHSFAVGKETMLLQLIRDSIINGDYVIDRGIFSVLAWGVMEERITREQAESQLDELISSGLLNNCTFVYLYGKNPDGHRPKKDYWDKNETTSDIEAEIMESFINYTENKLPSTDPTDNLSTRNIHWINNKFDDSTLDEIKKIIVK